MLLLPAFVSAFSEVLQMEPFAFGFAFWVVDARERSDVEHRERFAVIGERFGN
jgi:hypothetical protein